MSPKPLIDVLLEALTAAAYGDEPDAELIQQLQTGPADIQLEDLEFDSLAVMEFCISVELNTGVELTPDHLEQCKTMADVVAFIEAWPATDE
ncbi:MAG: acyl carrier protein [Pseudomonadota bacterium]